MGTGYTRNDTSDNIANGKVINASDLDGEFDALEATFVATTGHTHDGTAGEGAPVTVLGPVQEYVADGTSLTPKTDDTYDLGTAAAQWKDLYIDGTANIDVLIADTATISAGTITGITDITVTDGGTGASTAAGARTNLGLVIGTDVQTEDAGLTSIAGLTTSADKMIYTSASDVYATTTLTAAGRALVDDASASDQRTTLGLVIGTDVQTEDAGLTSIAGLTTGADKMIYTSASDVYATTTLTAAGRAILDDASAAAQLVTLGLTATAAELNTLDGITASVTELNILDGLNLVNLIYPVGSVYMTLDDAFNPNTQWTGTTWVQQEGTVMRAGADGAAGTTGGSDTTTLATTNLPGHTHSFSATTNSTGDHTHSVYYQDSASGSGAQNTVAGSGSYDGTQSTSASSIGDHSHTVSGTSGSTGSGTAFTNLPAYKDYAVWERTV